MWIPKLQHVNGAERTIPSHGRGDEVGGDGPTTSARATRSSSASAVATDLVDDKFPNARMEKIYEYLRSAVAPSGERGAWIKGMAMLLSKDRGFLPDAERNSRRSGPRPPKFLRGREVRVRPRAAASSGAEAGGGWSSSEWQSSASH